MSNEVQSAETLLAELRELYQSLPRHMQVSVASLLRECTPQEEPEIELAS